MNKPITLCDRCDIYMSCLLNYDGPACRRNRTVEPTNADRIRAMTDEELADFIGGIFTIESDPWGDYDPRTVVTQEPRVELRDRGDALDWLRQEASDG